MGKKVWFWFGLGLGLELRLGLKRDGNVIIFFIFYANSIYVWDICIYQSHEGVGMLGFEVYGSFYTSSDQSSYHIIVPYVVHPRYQLIQNRWEGKPVVDCGNAPFLLHVFFSLVRYMDWEDQLLVPPFCDLRVASDAFFHSLFSGSSWAGMALLGLRRSSVRCTGASRFDPWGWEEYSSS